MSDQRNDKQSEAAFLGTYQRMIDALPSTEMDWPPAPRSRRGQPQRVNRMWTAVIALLLATAGFGVGWFAAPQSSPPGPVPQYQASPPSTAPAVPGGEGVAHGSAHEAVLAAAREQRPGLTDPTYRMVVIASSDTFVSLRVALQARGFCHWYGVSGRVVDGSLEWRAGPSGDDCEPQ